MNTFSLVVPGEPVPCERVRMSAGGHAFTPSKTRNYEQLVSSLAVRHANVYGWELGTIGPFKCKINVYRTYKRGDADNFAKSIKDGLTKAQIWKDDRYVTELHVYLFEDKKFPRAIVEVERL